LRRGRKPGEGFNTGNPAEEQSGRGIGEEALSLSGTAGTSLLLDNGTLLGPMKDKKVEAVRGISKAPEGTVPRDRAAAMGG